jgi:AcrR family transcriptional regulator
MMEDRRTQRTRKMLSDALLALIEERGYDSITVQQITNRANLGRATFYLHYKDKEQLLLDTLQGLHNDLEQQLSPLTFEDLATGNATLSTTVFHHVARHQDLYRVLLSERGAAFARHFLTTYITRQAASRGVIGLLSTLQEFESAVPLSFLAEYISGTLMTAISWWLDHGMPKTPEEMGQIVHQLNITSIVSVLGIDPERLQPEQAT